jgi:glutamyl-tRNA synthetase
MSTSAPRLRMAVPAGAPLPLSLARILLANWLFARGRGGEVVLRLEDGPEPGGTAAAEGDLAWLGLDWDRAEAQSGNAERYRQAAAALVASGRLYPCFESPTELKAKRARRLHLGRPASYDRAMLALPPDRRAAAEAAGKRPYWRFRLSEGTVAWEDLVLGRQQVALATLSDPVLVRADGTPVPAFAGAVDDLADGVTHVIRGADLLSTTAIACDLARALGHDPAAIVFAHLPAADSGEEGRRLHHSRHLTVRGLRQRGIEPDALAGYLARLGTVGEIRPGRPAELAGEFNLAAISRRQPRFDWRRLLAVNRQALARLPFAEVAPRLPHGTTEAFWQAVRGSLDLLSEARGYWEVVAGTIVPPVIAGEAEFLRTALDTLPVEPWDAAVWARWTAALKKATGRAGRSLVVPLRLALTGEEEGADLQALLPLIGRPRVVQRLVVAAR